MRGPFDRGGDGRPFKPGQSGNPEGSSKGRRGRPPGQKPHRVVLWDLQQAAKDKSKRGLEILEQCMEDTTCDWPTRLRAVEVPLSTANRTDNVVGNRRQLAIPPHHVVNTVDRS